MSQDNLGKKIPKMHCNHWLNSFHKKIQQNFHQIYICIMTFFSNLILAGQRNTLKSSNIHRTQFEYRQLYIEKSKAKRNRKIFNFIQFH